MTKQIIISVVFYASSFAICWLWAGSMIPFVVGAGLYTGSWLRDLIKCAWRLRMGSHSQKRAAGSAE
jgi:hypothetical protein